MAKPVLDVCVIIVNWNCAHDTVNTANMVAAYGYPVIVVDNGSDVPGEGEQLADAVGTGISHLVELETNSGYAGGMNAGMKSALTEGFQFAILLNPDVDADAPSLASMVAETEDPSVGAVGVAQGHPQPDGTIAVYPSAAYRAGPRAVIAEYCEEDTSSLDVDVVTGACILVRLADAEKVGFMDERFFHYKEEYDFVSAIRDIGNRVVYVRSSILLHRSGGSLPTSSPQARYYYYRNEILYVRRRFGVIRLILVPALFQSLVAELLSCKSCRMVSAIARGVVHGLLGIDGQRRV